MYKILVTGANGFVGSALCNALTRRQLPFAGAVRKNAAPSQCQVGALTAQTQWADALAGCGTVIHLAARVHVMSDAADDMLAAYRAVNVEATMNLARQAVALGVRRFVFVSSVKVNGEATLERPYTAHDAAAPVDPYGQSKFEAECRLREFTGQSGMELVIVRPPLVYGPGVRANFHSLMRLVRTGLPLPLGAVNNRRSMVALDNLVDLLILCCSHPAAPGQTLMVSDDHDVSIAELLRMLSAAMGQRARLFPVPPRMLAMAAALVGKSAEASRLLSSLQVDLSHTKRTLGWTPPVSMQESLEKTVAHFLSTH